MYSLTLFSLISMFHKNIEKETINNTDYRKVLHTAKHMQLVVMSLKPLEEIGEEVHADKDQFIRIEKGVGMAIINDVEQVLNDGSVVIVSAGQKHNIKNTSPTDPLKLYTIYSPPEHKPGTIEHDKPFQNGGDLLIYHKRKHHKYKAKYKAIKKMK